MPEAAELRTDAALPAAAADERLQGVIDLCADFYWEQDASGRLTVLRPCTSCHLDDELAERLAELSLEGAAGAPPGRADWQPYRAALATRQPFRDLLCEIRRASSAARYLSFSGQPIVDGQGAFCGYRGMAREVTTAIRAQQLSQLETTVLRVLAQAGALNDGMRAVIQAICESEHWEAGHFWGIAPQGHALRHVCAWPHSAARSTLGSRPSQPQWADGEPKWVGAAGVLVPVLSAGKLTGVLEFCAPAVAAPDVQLGYALRAAAAHTAHFYERSLADDRLRESEQLFASMMELAAIGIAHVALDGRLLYVNPQLCKMLQYTETELIGKTVHEISHPDDIHATDEVRENLSAGTIESFKIEKRYLRKDGLPIWVGLTVASKRDRSGALIAHVSIVEDISARKSAEERVHFLATHDDLTGLPNRATFGEILNHALEAAKRHAHRIAVLFIDLDRFKTINDSLGHEAGDELLREIASRLRQCLRASDVVARLGGDEFVVMLPDVGTETHAATVARNLNSIIMKPLLILGQECRVTASIGICVYPMEGQDDRSVLKNADMAMYQAKEEGKNNYQFYSPTVHAEHAGRLILEANLRRALELNELTLHYQAKVHFQTGAITGVEALLRWHNAVLGTVSPTQFIPVAEETGLIMPIGKWVLRTACAQNVAWQRQGLPSVRVCVNLSMRQLEDTHLIPEIESVLEDTGMAPELLELEMTESMIMHNADQAARVLGAIKALGVRLAIDDFGTGYSSLAQLKRFPIDTLKVDRSFIRELPLRAEDRAIAQAIIAVGKTLSLTIVAEGVETAEQQAFLREHGCDEMQGYYFSTPVAAAQFAELLGRNAASRAARR
ncbi:MAG: putative bifunctional diguanylate cyclase/phosphodiesterase [Steroidobacteraceae bacterium]